MMIPLQNYIGGAFRPPVTTEQPLLNPSDGRLLGYQAGSSDEDVEEALTHAQRCHQSRSWSGLGVKRADYLLRVAGELESRTEDLALMESINTGVVLKQTRFLMNLLPFIFKAAAQQVIDHPDAQILPGPGRIELWHKPWGPALGLAPWNSPAPIGVHKVASALAAGAPVILKPSEFTPFTTQKIFERIAACDFPVGAVQLIHGSSREGSRLVEDTRIKAVSFTGGLKGGQAIARTCAEEMKPLQLELGGHNPFIVLPDADWNAMLDGLMAGLTTLNGQWCRAVGRIFVPDFMKQDLVNGFRDRLRDVVLGQATDPHSTMGPLIHRTHKQHLRQTLLDLQNQGAILHGAAEPDNADDCYFAPKLITDLPLHQDRHEIFGPVATVHGYQRVEDLVPLVNDSLYGLAAYIYGSDVEQMYRMARELEVGSTKINGVSVTSLSPNAPRAAWGISGLGEEGNFETFRFFQGKSVVGVKQ